MPYLVLYFNVRVLARKLSGCVFIVLLLSSVSRAQDTLNISFGRISAEDFTKPIPDFASAANAVILADIGKTYFEGNKMGSMDMVFKRFIRVRILNRNGLGTGSFSIGAIFSSGTYADHTYSKGAAESINDIRGSTFNLENGMIKETHLDTASIFDVNIYGDYTGKRFAMPALKEGSIFDLSYTQRSIFVEHLIPWNFQSEYPCLWSEYEIRIPDAYHYRMKIQGSQKFDISTSGSVAEKFKIEFGGAHGTTIGDVHMSGYSNRMRWVKKNEKPFIREAFVENVKNYIDRITFQQEYFQLNDRSEKENDLSNWDEAGKTYFKRTGLTELEDQMNVWMDKPIEISTNGSKETDQIIRGIYYYLRNHFTCRIHEGIYPTTSLKEIFKNRYGSSADINLLLVAMLNHAGISSEPGILSSRKNGKASFEKPMFGDYSNIICVTNDGQQDILLDASSPKNPYGKLQPEMYNGGVHTLSKKNSRFISLSPDSLLETTRTSVFISGDRLKELTGELSTVFGADNSYKIREEVRKSSKEEYFRNKFIKTVNGADVINLDFDSLDNYEKPLVLHGDIQIIDFSNSDMLYFEPVLVPFINKNLFSAARRDYPVEFSCKTDYVYVLSMDIPKGVVVEEIPKSSRTELNGNEGFFEYIIQKEKEHIQMQVRMKLNKTVFPPEDYNNIRDFFNDVMKKQTEQIIFKKTNQ